MLDHATISTEIELRDNSVYSREQIVLSLIEVVYANGNHAEASRQMLAKHGLKLTNTKIKKWRTTYPQLFGEITRKLSGEITERLASQHEVAASIAVEKATEGMQELNLKDLDKRELSGAVRNLAVSAGVFTDKASVLRGRPTEVHEHRHAHEIVTKLRSLSPALIVDSTAEEDTEPASVDDES